MGQKDVNGTDLKKKKLLTFITNTIVYLLAKFVRANGYLSIQSQPVHNIARDQNTRMDNKNKIAKSKKQTIKQTKKSNKNHRPRGKGICQNDSYSPQSFLMLRKNIVTFIEIGQQIRVRNPNTKSLVSQRQ